MLAANYVAQHVELAYATTSYRSQGRTVDTTHSLVSPTTTREVLYVAATRGRESNMLYVDTTFDPDPATGHDGTLTLQSAHEVLAGVLANEGADLSAHETLKRAQRQTEDFSVLAAEYETLARAAQQQRWDELLAHSGLDADRLEQVRQSPAYGPLLAAFRDAESRGLDVEQTFPKLVAVRALEGAEDPASILHSRIERWVQSAGSGRSTAQNLIAGLVPRAVGVTNPDMARALGERDQTMQRRARELVAEALERDAVWISRLGPPPTDAARREQWMMASSTVAAYRDRWRIGSDPRPLGPDVVGGTTAALDHRNRATLALRRALRLSTSNQVGSGARSAASWRGLLLTSRPLPPSDDLSVGVGESPRTTVDHTPQI
jgi:hypothetical protein